MPSSAEQKSFSYIFIYEANKNIDQAKDVRTKSEKADAPHLHLLATRSCRWRHRTFLSQVVTSAFETVLASAFRKGKIGSFTMPICAKKPSAVPIGTADK